MVPNTKLYTYYSRRDVLKIGNRICTIFRLYVHFKLFLYKAGMDHCYSNHTCSVDVPIGNIFTVYYVTARRYEISDLEFLNARSDEIVSDIPSHPPASNTPYDKFACLYCALSAITIPILINNSGHKYFMQDLALYTFCMYDHFHVKVSEDFSRTAYKQRPQHCGHLGILATQTSHRQRERRTRKPTGGCPIRLQVGKKICPKYKPRALAKNLLGLGPLTSSYNFDCLSTQPQINCPSCYYIKLWIKRF
jgi:hypothetical protein